MLKFQKNGKKLMEMNDDGKVIYYDKGFEEKMKLAEEVKKEKENDRK